MGMATKNWIQATGVNAPGHKGALHRALHAKPGSKIPLATLKKAAHSKDPHLMHMAEFALNMRGNRH